MTTYRLEFPLVAMAACLSDRFQFATMPLLAEVSEVYQDGEFTVDIYLKAAIEPWQRDLFKRDTSRLDCHGDTFLKVDFAESGLEEFGAAVLSFIDEQKDRFVRDARDDGSLLIHDPFTDQYNPISELDNTVDLRPLLEQKQAA